MKNIKRALSILLACLLLMGAMPLAVTAQDNPINANDKWFGYGVDCYLLNPTLEAGDEDGLWYTFTAENAGILQLEHSYKDVDYQVTLWVNGVEYKDYDDGVHSRPITTYPVAVGDKATINIKTVGAAAGGVYANIKIVSGENDMTQSIKMKEAGAKVYVAAGATVYYQDDSTAAVYATKGLIVSGDSVEDVTVISVLSDTVSQEYTDTDGDNTVELTLGGSLGSAGAPPVKPKWAITNNSAEDRCFTLTVTDAAHECVYDNDTDVDCNSCGEIREIVTSCEHSYDFDCDTDCNFCGEVRETIGEHVYEHDFDEHCDNCNEPREIIFGITSSGVSISEDVNGLAMRFDATVEGMEMDVTTAIYDNATIGGHKLIGMGAVVWNDGNADHNIEDADGMRVANVPAVYLWDVSEDTVSYTVRVINIPDDHKDTHIYFRAYFIYEDEEGVQHTVYNRSSYSVYNWV